MSAQTVARDAELYGAGYATGRDVSVGQMVLALNERVESVATLAKTPDERALLRVVLASIDLAAEEVRAF